MLARAFEIARAQIAGERKLPHRLEAPSDVRERLALELTEEGATFEGVAGALAQILAETPSSASPAFFNQLFGGRDEIACLAEMLTPLVNTSMYTYKVAGPQILIEQEVIGRMLAKSGFDGGEGILCPGGSLATLTAMLIARNEAIEGARDRGLGPTTRVAVYTSADGHYSIRKNAGVLGLGRDSVRTIPTDEGGHMAVEALEAALRSDLARGLLPLLINATAGTTVRGSFDPIRSIANIARRYRVWLHVDGALGGSVALSAVHRHLLDGLELADSFVWNAHKMMGVPLPCSALLLKGRGLLERHLSESADYLFQADGDDLNPGTRSLQCGRRNDALKLWAAWKLHGDRGFDRRIGRLFELARYTASEIEKTAGLELLSVPESINVCFEVTGKSSAQICDRLNFEGRLLVGHGQAGGRRAIRLVCVNPDLETADIDSALHAICEVAEAISEGPVPIPVAR